MTTSSKHVVAGFIGRGMRNADGQGYERTTYVFADGDEQMTVVFGLALLNHLAKCNRPANRWLVMGTEQSIWDALIELVPAEQLETVESTWNDVADAVHEGKMTQARLDQWSADLSRVSGLEVVCSLVGPADDRDSQMRVWKALYDGVGNGDALTLDITHGFRHQPVLMTFMATSLRWFRQLTDLAMYYGALEFGNRVIELPLCNDLLKITEALATYRYADDFSRLVDVFEAVAAPKPELTENLKQVAFADSVNRVIRQAAHQAKEGLSQVNPSSALARALADVLTEPLAWIAEDRLAQRLRHKAEAAFAANQRLKGIILLYEALCVAGCQQYQTGDPLSYKAREASKEMLKQDPRFDNVANLRNAVSHGTTPENKDLQTALNHSDPAGAQRRFDEIVGEALALFDELTRS